MSKVITFSRVFPSYHPKAGERTYFIEKIYNSLYESDGDWSNAIDPDGTNTKYVVPDLYESEKGIKHHTIRAGHRWKVGDKFSPRVWSGKPYNSKQIIIAPDIEIKKVWDFVIQVVDDYSIITIDAYPFYEENTTMVTQEDALKTLALNDGLTVEDLKAWFKYPKPFEGQIICWSENINY